MLLESNFVFNVYYKAQHIIMEPDTKIAKTTEVNLLNSEIKKFNLNDKDLNTIHNAEFIREEINVSYNNKEYSFCVIFDDNRGIWVIRDTNFDILKEKIKLETNLGNILIEENSVKKI